MSVLPRQFNIRSFVRFELRRIPLSAQECSISHSQLTRGDVWELKRMVQRLEFGTTLFRPGLGGRVPKCKCNPSHKVQVFALRCTPKQRISVPRPGMSQSRQSHWVIPVLVGQGLISAGVKGS